MLLVEDDPSSGRGTKRFLEVNGWQVSWATDGQKGLTLFRREKPDAIVVDWEMPKMDGEALTRAIRQEDARTIIVVYSAKADEWGGERLYEVDADMVVDKGKGATLLLAALERCLRRATASGGDAYIHRLAAEAEFNVNTGRLKIGQKEVKLSGMLLNLLRTLYGRQYLLNRMMRGETLCIEEPFVTALTDSPPASAADFEARVRDGIGAGHVRGVAFENGKLIFSTPYSPEEPTRWMVYGKLLDGIVRSARGATRVFIRHRVTPENEKYHANSWLMRMGFGGAEHRELRHTLLGHLNGYAAFKSEAGMRAHREKYARLRREQQAAKEGAEP